MTDSELLLPPAVLELDQEEDDAWGAPPGPLCSVCEHPVCPMCPVPWCDRMECADDLTIYCCETHCKVDPLEFADWKQRAVEIMLSREHHCGTPLEEHSCWTDQLGPYCPTWRRIVRACTMCAYRLGADGPRASYVARGASGLQWYECPEHDELDNLAEDRREQLLPLSEWFAKLNQTTDPFAFTATFWGIPPKGEQ